MSDSVVDEWAGEFARLEGQWKEVVAAEVRAWESTFKDLVEHRNSLVRARKWVSGPTDFLTILGRQRRELDHCAVLAWLMDPKAPHGLGTDFLGGFLHKALGEGFAADDLARAETNREVSRMHSRADIVIDCPNMTVVIEAKVDAEEGSGQCDRLYKDWRGDCQFVFLTPRGDRPQTATGAASAAFNTMRMSDVPSLLEEALRESAVVSPDSPGRAAVQTYLQTLRREFP